MSQDETTEPEANAKQTDTEQTDAETQDNEETPTERVTRQLQNSGDPWLKNMLALPTYPAPPLQNPDGTFPPMPGYDAPCEPGKEGV